MYKKSKTKTKSGSTVTPWQLRDTSRKTSILTAATNHDHHHYQSAIRQHWSKMATRPPHVPVACSKLFTTITIDYCKQKQCDPKLAKQTKTQVQLETHALTQVTHRSYLSREKERKNSEMIKQFCWLMLCHRERKRRWRRRVVYKQTHKIGERVKEIQNPHKQI